MSLTLQYQARCMECGGVLRAGAEADAISLPDGRWAYSHPENSCPTPPPPRRQQNVARPGFDVGDLFITRKCAGRCMNVVSFKKGGRITPTCPYCQGEWLRGDMSVAWAA